MIFNPIMDTIDNHSTIPELPEIPPVLRDKLLEGEVIIFVGNGVSRIGGVLSWKELAHAFLEDWYNDEKYQLSYDAYRKLKMEKNDPLELLTICEGVLGKKYLLQHLSNKLLQKINQENKNENKLKEIYGYIRDLRAGYITTNYDSFLEDASPTLDLLSEKEMEYMKQLRYILPSRLNIADLNDSLNEHINKIVYLHGKIEQQSAQLDNKVILTLGDYLEHYHKDENRQNGRGFLEHLAKKTFLFIGLGLKEFEIIQHINPPTNSAGLHYLLLGMSNSEADLEEQYRKYYKVLHIQPIPYNISYNGYDQLMYVLKNWSEQIRRSRISKYQKLIKSAQDAENVRLIMELQNAPFE